MKTEARSPGVASRISLGDWPRLTRFYGITPLELEKLPHVIIELYATQLPSLRAQEILEAMLVADMPYADQSDRKRMRKLYLRELNIDEPAPQSLDAHSEAGQAAAAGLGISVTVESTKTPESEPET